MPSGEVAMGLSTVMNTALSGMNAATTLVEISADNLANSQTRGFKASRAGLITLAPQALLLGAPPTAGSAGTNPIQIGRGVQIGVVGRDFSQGAIVTNDQPPLLALDGKGLFILEGRDGTRRYTRDGQFHFSADEELVTADGDRVQGFGIDADGNLDRSHLTPLRIHLGSLVASPGGGTASLQKFSVSRNGRIVGHYSDGVGRTLGQLRIARFANPSGLASRAGNKHESTAASGSPIELDPGEAGAAEVISGASELS